MYNSFVAKRLSLPQKVNRIKNPCPPKSGSRSEGMDNNQDSGLEPFSGVVNFQGYLRTTTLYILWAPIHLMYITCCSTVTYNSLYIEMYQN